MKIFIIKLLTICTILAVFTNTANAATTTFNYQGKIIYNGSPANGEFHIGFILKSELNGTTFGQQYDDYIIENGLLNAGLNFGDFGFDGQNLVLEIVIVDPATGVNILLQPQIPINTSPYSIQANFVADDGVTTSSVEDGSLFGADFADLTIGGSKIGNTSISNDKIVFHTLSFEKFATNGASDGDVVQYNGASGEWESTALVSNTTPWNSNGNDINFNAGNVGIGVSSPTATLQVHGTPDDELLLSGSTGAPVLHFRRTSSGSDWVLKNDAATSNFYFQRELVPGHEIMTLTPSGNVGIGTTSPAGVLDVRNAGDETLLNVNSDGSINRKTQVKTLTLGYQAFQTEQNPHKFTVSTSGTLTGIENSFAIGGADISLYAPIVLPDNTKIIKYEFLAFDNDPINVVTSRLKYTSFSTNNISNTISLMNTGSIPGGIVVTDVSINHNYQSDRVYYAFITVPVAGIANTRLLFSGVRITYEIDVL